LSYSRSSAPSLRLAGPQSGAAAWLVAALIAQGTVVHFAAVRGVEPSLVLVAVVWFAMRAGLGRALLYGFFAGLGEDMLAFDPGGAWTIATTITAVLASLPTRRFFEDSMPFFMIVTALATLVRALIFWIVKKIEGFPAGLGAMHFHEALIAAALNAAVAAVVMFLARRFEHRAIARRRR
jgi:rod shape-determining protein MreD